MIIATFPNTYPVVPKENLMNQEAWQLYADFHVNNPSVEPTFTTQEDFEIALSDCGRLTVFDAEGNVQIIFRY